MPDETRADRTRRTLLLLHAAALAAHTPRAACEWLHTARQELDGLSPAAAAWVGGAVAVVAGKLLASDFGLTA